MSFRSRINFVLYRSVMLGWVCFLENIVDCWVLNRSCDDVRCGSKHLTSSPTLASLYMPTNNLPSGIRGFEWSKNKTKNGPDLFSCKYSVFLGIIYLVFIFSRHFHLASGCLLAMVWFGLVWYLCYLATIHCTLMLYIGEPIPFITIWVTECCAQR